MDAASLSESSRSRVGSITSTGTASSSVGVKIGGLWKRSQGLSRFTKPNYKHRVFILTDQSLSYYAGTVDRVGQQKGRIDLASIRAVEYVDTSAFHLAHTLQIVYYSKKSGFVKLYVTGADKTQAADWVSALRQVCYFNKDMLMHYHPGAYIKNKWSCCKQRGQVMLGCQPTYHLLTRSSSRYAQMRRRDTLTNKRSRNSTVTGGFSTVDRSERKPFKAGQGLSNSCMNLAIHPPHRIESFMDSPVSTRSSRFSTIDPTLTRVSFASSEGVAAEATMSSLKRRSRSKVGPEATPLPIDFEQLTSESSDSVGNVGTLQVYSDNDPEASPSPVPPPRTKRGSSSLTQSHSIHFVPRVTSISEDNGLSKIKSPLKHSNTFVVQRHNLIKRNGGFGKKIERGLSHSMGALSKPMIEPKVSATDPNIIHV